jgi:crotonobetainyl-CoA:carnitine CoA-transferase CaiB-like acyl-CoA transferase
MPGPRRAPHLGEHTSDVLRAAGYSDEKIAELSERGVIRCADPVAAMS